jgi:hypothetical protein
MYIEEPEVCRTSCYINADLLCYQMSSDFLSSIYCMLLLKYVIHYFIKHLGNSYINWTLQLKYASYNCFRVNWVIQRMSN